MRQIFVDVAVALLILLISGAIFTRLAGVEEGEAEPAWVSIIPLLLAMGWLFWRTMRRRRAQASGSNDSPEARTAADEQAATAEPGERWLDPDDAALDGDALDADVIDERIWHPRVESAIRNLGRHAFEQFTLRILAALELTDVRVVRIAFDGAVEALAVAHNPEQTTVYAICRRAFGSLGGNQVRDLRQLMEGQATEGLFISNGEFANAAVSEAEGGDPPIELIDRTELLDLMHEHQLGLVVNEAGLVTAVDEEWFRDLDREGHELGG